MIKTRKSKYKDIPSFIKLQFYKLPIIHLTEKHDFFCSWHVSDCEEKFRRTFSSITSRESPYIISNKESILLSFSFFIDWTLATFIRPFYDIIFLRYSFTVLKTNLDRSMYILSNKNIKTVGFYRLGPREFTWDRAILKKFFKFEFF